MKLRDERKNAAVKILGFAVAVVLGLAIALGLAEMMLRTFPNVLPPEVRVNSPVRRVKAFVDESYELKLSDGDLFHYMRGKVVHLSPE